jgi:hypothetical protein
MSSTYSTNLAIELMGAGDQAGNWGSTTNTNLGTLIEQAISGYVSQAVVTGTDTTITIPNGATGVARNMFIQLTGSGGASTNLIVPANKKLYFIYNATASGQVTVKVSGQTGVSVPNGAKMILVSNGTDIIDATNYMSSLTLGTPLAVAQGGTGGTTSTGSGAVVLATSPTITSPSLVTPALGTPASGTMTNVSGTAVNLSAGSLTTGSTPATAWTVTQSGTKLNFAYGGTTVFSIDSSGNIIAKANVTAYGTP